MRTFRVKRRFFHYGRMCLPGETIELEPAEAGRLGFIGAVEGPLKKPVRARKPKKVRDGSNAN